MFIHIAVVYCVLYEKQLTDRYYYINCNKIYYERIKFKIVVR